MLGHLYSQEWVSRNPQIVWFAFDETGAVLGYIYGIPLEIHAFNRILHPGWNEKDIKVSEIRRYDMVRVAVALSQLITR